MSLSVSMTLSNVTPVAGEVVEVELGISNNSTSDVKVLEVYPTPQSGTQQVLEPMGQLAITIPSEGLLVCSYHVRIFGSDFQTIAARVYGSDGTTAVGSAGINYPPPDPNWITSKGGKYAHSNRIHCSTNAYDRAESG